MYIDQLAFNEVSISVFAVFTKEALSKLSIGRVYILLLNFRKKSKVCNNTGEYDHVIVILSGAL